MIRFMPDTWREALLRPIAMAAPDGGVYVETIAPDLRFVFILVLFMAWLTFRVRTSGSRRATLFLLAFTAISFIPWLATTGNGRYFLPFLFLAGPLAIALLYHLPWSPVLRASIAVLMIGLQLFLVRENEPWNSWGLAPWTRSPAFGIDVPEDVKRQPATFVTLNAISYSIIAPQFHPDSRWISLASQSGGPPENLVGDRTRRFLFQAIMPKLLLPSPPGQLVREGLSAVVLESINQSLSPYGLAISVGELCRFMPSLGLSALGTKVGETSQEERGFWLCPLQHVSPSGHELAKPDPKGEAVFAKIEEACPRLFPREATTSVMVTGSRRFYVSSDMRLYVLNDGRVMYKYMRALNMALLGNVADVLAPSFRMDCGKIRGRSGLPWEREI